MSNFSDAAHHFTTENDCGCPTKYWKAFLMDYVSLPIYNRVINELLTAPCFLANVVTFGNFCGGTFYTHDAVTIYFKCLNCGSKFSITFDLVKSGTRQRPGYYNDSYLEKYHQTKLWFLRDEMKPVVDEFTFGPEKHHRLFYNCSHFANKFYDAICKLDEKSRSAKWSNVMGYCVSPIYYKAADCFIHENVCSCSSKDWKSYQMDLNKVMIIDDKKKKGLLGIYVHTTDIDVLTLHFKCSECRKLFKSVFYYYNQICRKNGIFHRILTSNPSIPFEIPHDSLKPILYDLVLKKETYTSQEYARDLFNALFEASAVN